VYRQPTGHIRCGSTRKKVRQVPCAVAQFAPSDKDLWKKENYVKFLEERGRILKDSLNQALAQMLG